MHNTEDKNIKDIVPFIRAARAESNSPYWWKQFITFTWPANNTSQSTSALQSNKQFISLMYNVNFGTSANPKFRNMVFRAFNEYLLFNTTTHTQYTPTISIGKYPEAHYSADNKYYNRQNGDPSPYEGEPESLTFYFLEAIQEAYERHINDALDAGKKLINLIQNEVKASPSKSLKTVIEDIFKSGMLPPPSVQFNQYVINSTHLDVLIFSNAELKGLKTELKLTGIYLLSNTKINYMVKLIETKDTDEGKWLSNPIAQLKVHIGDASTPSITNNNRIKFANFMEYKQIDTTRTLAPLKVLNDKGELEDVNKTNLSKFLKRGTKLLQFTFSVDSICIGGSGISLSTRVGESIVEQQVVKTTFLQDADDEDRSIVPVYTVETPMD